MEKYNMELDISAGSILEKTVGRIRPGSLVLEFGCAYGRLTKYMKETLDCRVYIVELDPEAYASARPFAEDGVCGDIEKGEWVERFASRRFDYILFADVLEHLRDPEKALRQATMLLKEQGEVIVSLPNVAHFDVLSNLYRNRFHYTEVGLLDNTHVHFWGKEDLENMSKGAGLQIIVLDGVYVAPHETEQAVRKEDIPEELEAVLRKKPLADLYQFFLVMKKEDAASTDRAVLNDELQYYRNHPKATFYFDCGGGYSEESSLRMAPEVEKDGETFRYHLPELPQGCRKIRFDPVCGWYCAISGLTVMGDEGGSYPFSVLNGSCLTGEITFAGTEPHIEILLPQGAKTLDIRAKVAWSRDMRWATCFQAVEKSAALEKEAAALKEENSQHRDVIRRLEEELKNCREELHSSREELHSSRETLAIRENQLEKTREEAEKFRQDLDASRQETEYMTAYARHVEQMYHELADRYNAVLGSRSWRITAPLRHFTDFLRYRMKLQLVHKALIFWRQYGTAATWRKVVAHFHKEQPVELKLPEKIESVTALEKVLSGAEKSTGIKVYLGKVLKSYDHNGKKNVLLLSHEMNLTGAPVAVSYFAEVLKENGYNPLILSPRDGRLTATMEEKEIPVIIAPPILTSDMVASFAGLFQLIVLNTIVTVPVLGCLSELGLDTPVFWWIHEAEASYTEETLAQMPQLLTEQTSVYVVGGHAKRILLSHRPDYDAKELLYYSPDYSGSMQNVYQLPAAADGKTVFCSIGMLEYRKGQDVLAEAITLLPEETRKKSYFVFVGKQCYEPNYQCIQKLLAQYPENVLYIEELSIQDVQALHRRLDCFICSSRDDPMPIVVTEALEHGKMVICSEYTGSAMLLEQEHSGLVYHNNDPKELCSCIVTAAESKGGTEEMGRLARATYEAHFSREVFEKNVLTEVRSLMDKTGEIGKLDGTVNRSMERLLAEFEESCTEEDCIYEKEQLLAYDKEPKARRILLLSHEFSMTGAPIALLHLAESFRGHGAQIVILSPFDGPMGDEFRKCGLPALVYHHVYEDEFLFRQARKFDLIVLNTVVAYRAVTKLQTCGTPVLWWIHDSKESYEHGGFGDCLPEKVPENTHVYCPGAYARRQLLSYYPNYTADILYYMIPDKAEESQSYPVYEMGLKEGPVRFAVIGLQDYRKGHDILAKAITLLSEKEREKAEFFFVGGHLDPEIQKAVDEVCERYPDKVRYIPQLNREQIHSLYRQVDCVICTSRDDPLPVFVTEALMMSRPVICSENTGWSPILEQERCGLVYHGDEAEKLVEQIRRVLQNREALQPMCERGRAVYCKYFSETALSEKSGQLLSELIREPEADSFEGMVSVIIPTYNAGRQFDTLLQRLQTQKKIRSVEIVVIDSGSTDETQSLCAQHGVRFVPIPHERFSHSYARNKGALLSKGDLLLFMTQDALPLDELWMYHLAQPILSGDAAAVSCIEKCPEGTDLYYAAASRNHIFYQGVQEKSRFSRLDPADSANDLRSKSSLNDVTSMIRADVFKRFLYRFSYAEDLDMGLRLLKAGYTIGLINTTASVHGHNRPAGYYIKRGFVEAKGVGKICGLWKVPPDTEERLARRIVYGDALLDTAMMATVEGSPDVAPLKEFEAAFLQNLGSVAKNKNTAAPRRREEKDPLLVWCLDALAPFSTREDERETELLPAMAYYFSNVLVPYLENTGMTRLDKAMQRTLCGCVEKQFCLNVGNLLAGLPETSQLYREKIRSLAAGV